MKVKKMESTHSGTGSKKLILPFDSKASNSKAQTNISKMPPSSQASQSKKKLLRILSPNNHDSLKLFSKESDLAYSTKNNQKPSNLNAISQ